VDAANTLEPGLGNILSCYSQTVAALAHFMKGERGEAMELVRDARAGVEFKAGLATSWAAETEMHFHTGDHEAARASALETLKVVDDIHEIEATIYASSYLGMLDVLDGDMEAGLERLRNALSKAEGHFTAVLARRLLGQALVEHGSSDADRREGRSMLMKALGLARRQENGPEIYYIQEVLNRCG